MKINHVMIIPDGDRRYAKKKGVTKIDAYKKAAKIVRNLVDWVLVRNEISEFTLFGLSYSNIARRITEDLQPVLEVQSHTLTQFAEDYLPHKYGIKVIVSGEKHLLPREYQHAITTIEEVTQNYSKRKLNILIGYSGKLDFERALQKTLQQHTTPTLENILKNSSIETPIDYLIRTAGEKRVSDSPLFALQNTEFYFIDKLFPEVTKKDIDRALKAFKP